MNLPIASRQLVQASCFKASIAATLARGRVLPSGSVAHQRRCNSLFSRLNPFRSKSKSSTSDKLLDDPNRLRKLAQESTQAKLQSSIFEDEVADAERKAGNETSQGGGAAVSNPSAARAQLSPHDLLATSDPDPRSRQRWERKMIIQMVRRNGRESRQEVIARTERQVRHKSPFMATSVKKLVQVARQVSGKTIDEAIIQMEFSKKKVAREVKYHLERARDEAVAIHGMGLGRQNGELTAAAQRRIRTKDGDWLDIKDPTRLYVSEAWVNRGPHRGYRLIHMGRGRRSVWKRPTAGISLVIKEEKTRIRMHDERVAKERAEGPWVHHPNRPVTAQRQYYTW